METNVTDAGPVKEKQLIEEVKNGGVRFRSEIPHCQRRITFGSPTLTSSPVPSAYRLSKRRTPGLPATSGPS